MIEPLKAWIPLRKEMFLVHCLDFETSTVTIQNDINRFVIPFNMVQFIRSTPFYDINGPDPSRKLWEGDVMECIVYGELMFGVIVWSQEYGWWSVAFEKGSHRYLYNHIRHYRAKYVGNVWANPELVPWYRRDDNEKV